MFLIGNMVILVNDKDQLLPPIFIIYKIDNEMYYIKGCYYRTYLKVNKEEIILADNEKIKNVYNRNETIKNNFIKQSKVRHQGKALFGRILHIDGDEEYLKSCLDLYKELQIPAEGIYIKEANLKEEIENYILQVTPDIVVITGHDAYNNMGIKSLENYENTTNFIEAIRIIRKHYNQDTTIIISGACSSHFEALIGAGANFASSPGRISIHTYDPEVIAIKVASTSCNKTIDFENVLKHIENKRDAYGGIETKGKMKLLY